MIFNNFIKNYDTDMFEVHNTVGETTSIKDDLDTNSIGQETNLM